MKSENNNRLQIAHGQKMFCFLAVLNMFVLAAFHKLSACLKLHERGQWALRFIKGQYHCEFFKLFSITEGSKYGREFIS